MLFREIPCDKFTEILASKEPVPGGGGASALCGATAAALGNMVGSLTVGKKKYQDVEDEIIAAMEKGDELRKKLLVLMDKDAEVFAPLAQAYSLPKGEEKDRIMEEALKLACSVPLEIMETLCEAVDLIEIFACKGSRMAVSDAGAGAVIAGAAIKAASLNVYINTSSMKDRAYADDINKKADEMIAVYGKKAEDIFKGVFEGLK